MRLLPLARILLLIVGKTQIADLYFSSDSARGRSNDDMGRPDSASGMLADDTKQPAKDNEPIQSIF